jgi:hypothetical protein
VERLYAMAWDHAVERVVHCSTVVREPLLLLTKDHNPPTQAYRSISDPLVALRRGDPVAANVEFVNIDGFLYSAMRKKVLQHFEDLFARYPFRDDQIRALAKTLTWVVVRRCSAHDIHNGLSWGACPIVARVTQLKRRVTQAKTNRTRQTKPSVFHRAVKLRETSPPRESRAIVLQFESKSM